MESPAKGLARSIKSKLVKSVLCSAPSALPFMLNSCAQKPVNRCYWPMLDVGLSWGEDREMVGQRGKYPG